VSLAVTAASGQSAGAAPLSLDDLECLGRCVTESAAGNDLERARTLAAGSATASIIIANRIGPLLARALRRDDPGRALPETLAGVATDAARSSLAVQQRLRELSTRFAAAHVRWLLWKGPAIALQAWGNPALRSFADIDIVVESRDRARAVSAIVAAGWRPRDGMSLAQQRWVLRGSGAYEFEREGETLLVELHWRFASGRYPTGIHVTDAMSRAEPLVIDGLEVLVPGPADTLLLAALHATKHGWSQAEEALTFDRLHASRPDAAVEAGERAIRSGLGDAWRLAMEVRGALLSTRGAAAQPTPGVLAAAALERMRRGDGGWRPDHRWTLSWITRDRDRVRYWLHALLAPTREEWKWMRLPGPLAWLYPFVRVIRLAVRR
jgi:hypothetical protein